ncbi:MAG: hypothetical protein ACRCX2_03325 [Paraclostridium sp.]
MLLKFVNAINDEMIKRDALTLEKNKALFYVEGSNDPNSLFNVIIDINSIMKEYFSLACSKMLDVDCSYFLLQFSVNHSRIFLLMRINCGDTYYRDQNITQLPPREELNLLSGGKNSKHMVLINKRDFERFASEVKKDDQRMAVIISSVFSSCCNGVVKRASDMNKNLPVLLTMSMLSGDYRLSFCGVYGDMRITGKTGDSVRLHWFDLRECDLTNFIATGETSIGMFNGYTSHIE